MAPSGLRLKRTVLCVYADKALSASAAQVVDFAEVLLAKLRILSTDLIS